jgi:hypothetical protein
MNADSTELTLTPEDLAALRRAKLLLENPGFAARLAHKLGTPIEKGFRMLPDDWTRTVQRAAHNALTRALELAVVSLGEGTRGRSSNFLHKVLVGATGGVGGAFGLAALPFELPVSTTLMLRSIADIARSEGHVLGTVETRLACLEVFALGGRSPDDDAAENAYWATRALLARAVSEAASYLARRGTIIPTAPPIVRLIAAIASRFGVVVSEQVAAKAVPVVGAASGSVINVLFMDHFQSMARGHFIVRRLEAGDGQALIRSLYEAMPIPAPGGRRVKTPAA